MSALRLLLSFKLVILLALEWSFIIQSYSCNSLLLRLTNVMKMMAKVQQKKLKQSILKKQKNEWNKKIKLTERENVLVSGRNIKKWSEKRNKNASHLRKYAQNHQISKFSLF